MAYCGPAWPLAPDTVTFNSTAKLSSEEASVAAEHGVDPALWKQSSLTSLDLTGLQLTSLIGVENLPKLSDLTLDRNQLGQNWEDLTLAPTLTLSNTQGGSGLFALKALKALSLACCSLDTLPPAIASLALLQSLNIRGNNLTTLPVALGLLPELHTIIASENPITALPEVTISSPYLSPSLSNPQALFEAPRLASLQLRACQLTTLEVGISRLPLVELDCNSNHIEGFSHPTPTLTTSIRLQ